MTKVGKSLEIPLNANVAKWQVTFFFINPSNELSSNKSAFSQYISLLWPVRQSRAALEIILPGQGGSLTDLLITAFFHYLYSRRDFYWYSLLLTHFCDLAHVNVAKSLD